MINIEIKRKNKDIVMFEVKGHANFDNKGKDIVCSAVSAIVFGGLNALQNDDLFKIKIEDNLVEFKALDELSLNDKIVLNTLYIQLKTIEASYSNYITIREF